MISVHIITVGRDKDSWVEGQVEHFRRLLAKYATVEISAVAEEHYGPRADLARLLAREAQKIEARLKGGMVIALDVDGRAFDTKSLAREIQRRQNKGASLFEFVIGGPYGLDETLKKKADLRLSLSPLTLSHQITRGVLLEQLYRVFNLNAGGHYHK